MTAATVKADYRTRVIAFDSQVEAKEEVRAWARDGYRARIIVHGGIFNVLVAV